MAKPTLTLESLFKTRLPRLDPAALPLREIRADPQAASLDWIATADAQVPTAEAAPAALAAAAESIKLGPFAVEYGAETLVLLENGVERWRIETTLFGGHPKLEVDKGAGAVEIALHDAFYPGTLIPASLRAGIRKVGNDWILRLRLKYGGFDATLPLGAWLGGFAASLVHLDFTACPLGPASELAAGGIGLAAFRPDWLLSSVGVDLLRLDGFEADVTADAMLVALFGTTGPAFFLPAALRRTVVWLFSLEEFPLQPELSQAAPRVDLGPFRFDSVAIEAGIDAGDRALRALYAQSADDVTVAGFEPGADLRGGSGEPFRVPLRDPRWLQLFGDDRALIGAGFIAEVAEERVWMHSPGQSLLLKRPGRQPFVAVLDLPGQPLVVHCRLGLEKTAPRVEGMLVRPRPAPPRTEMIFTWGPLAQPLTALTGHVEVDLATGIATILLPPNTSLAVVRRDDFLVLGYEWFNRRFESRGQDRRLRAEASPKSHLAVVFPPQSIAEEVYFEASDEYKVDQSDMHPQQKAKQAPVAKPAQPPIPAMMAGPSRLVFALGGGFEVTASSLLDWSGLAPALARNALPGSALLTLGDQPPVLLPGPAPDLVIQATEKSRAGIDRHRFGGRRKPLGNVVSAQDFIAKIVLTRIVPLVPAEPSPTTTQIELPFRLILSPNKFGVWVHSPDAVTHGDRTELWHTRLATRYFGAPTEGPHVYRTVRAIWSRDHDHQMGFDKPFLTPLDWDDRKQLVHLTSDFTLGLPDSPAPVTVNKLMLSALGGWLDSDYRLPLPDYTQDYSIEQWRHRATMGRDHYVRVVYKGSLLPCGHRASLVKISERKVEPTPVDGDPAAYVRQRMYIVVREPERVFTGSGHKHGGREMPFKRVRITTVVTPDLDPPWESPLGADPPGPPLGGAAGTPPILAFWPRVGNADFRFHLKAWDWEGHEVDFVLPLAFVRQDWAKADYAVPTNPIAAYNAEPQAERRRADLGGQQVAFAESEGFEGKTTFDTAAVRFRAFVPEDSTGNPIAMPMPPYYPELGNADVAIAALRQMTGSNDPATIVLDPHYLEHAFHPGKNKAGLFAKVPSAAPRLDYKQGQSADRAGGVATPTLAINGLSRELGTVGDTSTGFAEGTFNPASFFPGDAQLLGGITLNQILDSVGAGDFLARTPKLVTTDTALEITTSLHWETTSLKESDTFKQKLGGSWRLQLDSLFKTDKAGGAREFRLEGQLTDFIINLAGVIEVDFTEFRFSAVDGKKPDVHVVVTDVRFVGDLEFLNKLDKILSPANFADPPFIDVTPQGITAGYNLEVPTVAMGVFALSNLALGARMNLPFTGEAMRLRFNLSERHDPFIVSIAPFGGGGFFAIAVGGDGVEVLEASIEFGGNISIDLGVASGGVSLMAGIYVKIELSDSCELTGYVRANGELSVLGIVSISMEFYLGLTYAKPKAWGEVRVTVTISVLIFSGSVTVHMRREFAGSSQILPFSTLMPYPRWQAYAAAFA